VLQYTFLVIGYKVLSRVDVWLETGSGLVNGFIDHLYTRHGTTSTYNAIADLHTLPFTIARTKSSQSAFTNRFLVMLLTMEILQLLWSRRCPLANTQQFNYSSISSQPSLQNLTKLIQSQSQSYVTTDGQSASLSWCQAPIWGLWPDINYCLTYTVLSFGGRPL
jgi:hypothetical protein